MKGVIVTVFVPMQGENGRRWITGYDLYEKSMVVRTYSLDGTLSQNLGRRMYQYSRYMAPRPWTEMFQALQSPAAWSRVANSPMAGKAS